MSTFEEGIGGVHRQTDASASCSFSAAICLLETAESAFLTMRYKGLVLPRAELVVIQLVRVGLICYNSGMADVIHIVMVRENLDSIPQHSLPEGYSIRTFKRGDGPVWAGIGAAAGNFGTLEAARDRFEQEFAEPVDDMESRCFFIVENESNLAIGTAMAWYDLNFNGEPYGRVHWVAIVPEHQGKGLAKPLMSVVLNRLAESHDKATLGTQTFRRTAVKLYLDLGFKPFFKNPTCPEAWKELANDLKHPALSEYRS
jgi:GNAT superfamily N-acetyltransferase